MLKHKNDSCNEHYLIFIICFIYLFIPTVSHPLSSTCSSPAGFHQFTVGVDSLLLSNRKHKFVLCLCGWVAVVRHCCSAARAAGKSVWGMSVCCWLSQTYYFSSTSAERLNRPQVVQVLYVASLKPVFKGTIGQKKSFFYFSGCSDVVVLRVTVVVLMDSKNITQAWNTASEKWYLNKKQTMNWSHVTAAVIEVIRRCLSLLWSNQWGFNPLFL